MSDWRNKLYYGDCYEVLRKHIAAESVDLVYLDPPFNSNRDYNVLFKEQTGAPAEAQVKAFTDTWKWSEDLYAEWDHFVDTCPNQPLVALMQSFIQYLKRNDVTAYLARMTPRLYELHRVLKGTGSLYLHCDPAASHYLKIILDLIFGPTVFRNEIIWRRTGTHNKVKRFGPVHDVIFYYRKSEEFTWNYPVKRYMKGHVEENFKQMPDGSWRTNYYGNVLTGSGTRNGFSGEPWRGFDPTAKGRHWAIPGKLLDEIDEDFTGMNSIEKLERLYELGFVTIKEGEAWPMYERTIKPSDGSAAPDLWAFQPYTNGTVFGTKEGIDEDVRWLGTKDQERLGYPTQKPVALLKRILEASSNPGDIVLDPFCGCGTTVMAAQELQRKWIGIDITATATSLIEARLLDTFGIHNTAKGDYDIIGLPTTEFEAIELANRDKHEFQKWAISLVPRAMPWQEKKGADGGVDGFVRFRMPGAKETSLTIISVKGGQNLKMDDIKNLGDTMEAQKAAMGFLITLVPPSGPMGKWAQDKGMVKSDGTAVPRVQIRTVGQLLRGEGFAFPWNSTISGIPKAGEGQSRMDF